MLYCTTKFILINLRWKPILYRICFLGTKLGIHGQVKGWQRSGNFGRVSAIQPFWAKWGLDESRRAGVFCVCGKPDDLLATSQRPLFTKFGHETYFGVPPRNPERHFRQFSLLPPKSVIESWSKSNRHLTQSMATGHGMHCREIGLLRVYSKL